MDFSPGSCPEGSRLDAAAAAEFTALEDWAPAGSFLWKPAGARVSCENAIGGLQGLVGLAGVVLVGGILPGIDEVPGPSRAAENSRESGTEMR